ncbi:MAG: phosphotransferase [Planctomycetaceae bacterium]|nr:phosphotransferase [Planctomycetaceae bacterium]
MLSIQSDQELHQIIGLYGPAFQPDQWPLVCGPHGFSGAAIYRFTANSCDYALRVWPTSESSAAKLEAMTRLLEDLHRNGISYVAAAVRKQDGTVATVSRSGSLIHIEPWLPGKPEDSLYFSALKQENAMQSLARWHQAAAHHLPDSQHLDWIRPAHSGRSPGLAHRKIKLEQYLKKGILTENQKLQISPKSADFHHRLQICFQAHAASLWSQLQQATQQALPLQPVLRDVWRDHVLFTGDEVTGIIDPAAFGTDSVVTDITRLLGSIAGNNWELWDKALTSYHTSRPLSQIERNVVGIFDLSNLLLSAIGCFERYLTVISNPADFPVDSSDRLSGRLAEYLSRLEYYRR